MSSFQIINIFAALFVVSLMSAIAAVVIRLIKQNRLSKKMAIDNGYGFWQGYPGMTHRYPESRLFYEKLYVNACFINTTQIEVGVTSRYMRYMTMLVGDTDTETLYIDGTKDNSFGAEGRSFAQNMYANENGTLRRVELERIVLEGDFYQHFKVLQPIGQQIETLSLLSPDVMEQLIDKYGDCNIEIHQGRLTVFMAPNVQSRRTKFDIAFVKDQFEKAEQLKKLLIQR